jgi:hypothetical protein
MSFCVGNAFKYVWRAGLKGSAKKELEDLKKAAWFLNDARDHMEAEPSEAALAAFRFIVDDKSDKYKLLSLIIDGRFLVALDLIEDEIEEIEDEGILG